MWQRCTLQSNSAFKIFPKWSRVMEGGQSNPEEDPVQDLPDPTWENQNLLVPVTSSPSPGSTWRLRVLRLMTLTNHNSNALYQKVENNSYLWDQVKISMILIAEFPNGFLLTKFFLNIFLVTVLFIFFSLSFLDSCIHKINSSNRLYGFWIN